MQPWLEVGAQESPQAAPRKKRASSILDTFAPPLPCNPSPAGLVEPEWLETLPVLDPETLVYTDFVEEGRCLARQLRVGC